MSIMLTKGEWFSVKEVAEELGITDGRVRQFILEGRLKGKKIGPAWAIKKQELQRFKSLERNPGNPLLKKLV